MNMKEYSIIDAFFEDNPYKDEEKFVDKNLDITEQIYAYLKEKGWSQSEFADKLGKKSSEISRWLSGTHNLTLKSLTKMETILGEDIITTPQKAKKKYETIKYIEVPVHAKSNDNTNNEVLFTDSKSTTVEEDIFPGKANFAMAA